MAIDTFQTATLNRVVRQLPEPDSFLLNGVGAGFNGFVPEIQTEDSEEIHFDREEESRRITPFVSPIRSGRVVKSAGFTTESFQPAYAKDKRVFEPDAPMKRSMGEQIGGSLSPAERRRARVARELRDQTAMLTRREEAMFAEFLRTGAITVAGDGFPTRQVDFNRAAALTITLAGTDMWSDAAATVVDDLENWAELMSENNGGNPTDIVMASNVWQVMRTKQDVRDAINRDFAQTSGIELGPLAGQVRLVGILGDFRLWVYTSSYTDVDGVTRKFVPSDWLFMINQNDLEAVRAYGVILDEKADYSARRLFSKSWIEEDPAVRYLLMQSAPLVVPYRPNASLAANVINN